MFYVYVLKSEKDGRFYKGMTQAILKRVEQHNRGENKSAKGFMPWKLVYQKSFKTRLEARAYEKLACRQQVFEIWEWSRIFKRPLELIMAPWRN